MSVAVRTKSIGYHERIDALRTPRLLRPELVIFSESRVSVASRFTWDGDRDATDRPKLDPDHVDLPKTAGMGICPPLVNDWF